MTLIYVLLVAHFVADFLCQSDWMALNKSKNWQALTAHVAAYAAALFPFLVLIAARARERGFRFFGRGGRQV